MLFKIHDLNISISSFYIFELIFYHFRYLRLTEVKASRLKEQKDVEIMKSIRCDETRFAPN